MSDEQNDTQKYDTTEDDTDEHVDTEDDKPKHVDTEKESRMNESCEWYLPHIAVIHVQLHCRLFIIVDHNLLYEIKRDKAPNYSHIFS